jgi:AraC-like DNA-binding protein
MPPTIRAVSLTNYIEVARFLGVDPYEMLGSAQIDPELLRDPEARLPAKAAIDMLADTAARSGCASLGLLMAECRSVPSIGALSLLLQHQSTLRGMIVSLEKHQRHLSDIHRHRLEDDGQVALIHCEIDHNVASVEAVELQVALTYRILSEFAHWSWRAEAVHFTHRAPADLEPYRRFFQCGLDFGAEFNGLSCASAALDLPNTRADPEMMRNAERLVNLVPLPDVLGSLSNRVCNAIHLLIPNNGATLQRVSNNLGLPARSLQRALGKDGTSFAALLNGTRRDLAARYLASEHHSVRAIAALAGYSSQSAFTRWFVGEFEVSPAVWRALHRSGRHAPRSAE